MCNFIEDHHKNDDSSGLIGSFASKFLDSKYSVVIFASDGAAYYLLKWGRMF